MHSEKTLRRRAAKEALRRRIRQQLNDLVPDRTLTPDQLRQAEEQVLALFKDYGPMPERQRNRVWKERMSEIVESLRSKRAVSESLRTNYG